jgi:hypothetical protein
MSALAERERRARVGLAEREREGGPIRAARLRPWRRKRGGPTLSEVVSTAWAGLGAAVPVACPVCGGHMVALSAPGGPPPLPGDPHPGGDCRDCGSRLS